MGLTAKTNAGSCVSTDTEKDKMPDMELLMVPQGIEIGRSDFGNEIRDRIAFEVCFAMNTICADKKSLLTLLYSTADSIIAATNAVSI